MPVDIVWTRKRSAAIFGNEKFVEVILAVDDLDEPKAATAQDLSRATGIAHAMVRDVLRRLTSGELMAELPRIGGSRSALYYSPRDANGWKETVSLARSVVADEPDRARSSKVHIDRA